MEITETEKLYSPSYWAKNITPTDRINNHNNFITENTNRSRRNISCELNIRYGSKDTQKYDIYGVDLPNDVPIFVFIHGGYWQQLSKDVSGFMAENFHKHNIKTIVIGYSLCPNATLQEIVIEIETAVKNILEYAKTRNSRGIYISGYSAGAHLIASLFAKFYPSLSEEHKSLFKATILCCGVYDLTPLIGTYINKPLKLNYEEARTLSPMFQNVDTLGFAVYIVVGENDSPAFIKQSKQYYEKIRDRGNILFKVIDNVDHFDIVEKYNNEDYELFQYIKK